MIQNMKLGTNNIEVIFFVLSVSVISYPPFVCWWFQSMLFIINRNLHRTVFCTILQSIDDKGCGHGMCLTCLPTL